jgi:hypothetical protein
MYVFEELIKHTRRSNMSELQGTSKIFASGSWNYETTERSTKSGTAAIFEIIQVIMATSKKPTLEGNGYKRRAVELDPETITDLPETTKAPEPSNHVKWYGLKGFCNSWVKITNDSASVIKIVYKTNGTPMKMTHVELSGSVSGGKLGVDFDYNHDEPIQSFYLYPGEFRDLTNGGYYISVILCYQAKNSGLVTKYIVEENLSVGGGRSVAFEIPDTIIPYLRVLRED